MAMKIAISLPDEQVAEAKRAVAQGLDLRCLDPDVRMLVV